MLVDQFGNSIFRQKIHSANYNDRTMPKDYTSAVPESIEKQTSWKDYLQLVGMSRKLFANNGIFKAASELRSTWAVQDAFMPVVQTDNQEFNEAATNWLTDFWYVNCSINTSHDFKTLCFLDSTSIDINGDAFIVLVLDETGMPTTIRYPSWQCHSGSDKDRVSSGTFKNSRIDRGIIKDRLGRVIGYRFVDDEGRTKDFPRSAVIHLFDPSFTEMSRGIPFLSHGIKQFIAIDKSCEMELLAQQIAASYALVETNETGMPEMDDFLKSTTSVGNGSAIHDISGGAIKFFQAGTGSKIEALNYNRPAVEWTNFQERMLKTALIGTGISYEMLIGKDMTGPSQRSSIRRMEIAIADRQAILITSGKRQIAFALATAIDAGLLPKTKDFGKVFFTLPKPLSIDILKDGANMRADLKAGIQSMSDAVSSRSKNLRDHYVTLASEYALKEQIRREISETTGIQIPASAMGETANI